MRSILQLRLKRIFRIAGHLVWAVVLIIAAGNYVWWNIPGSLRSRNYSLAGFPFRYMLKHEELFIGFYTSTLLFNLLIAGIFFLGLTGLVVGYCRRGFAGRGSLQWNLYEVGLIVYLLATWFAWYRDREPFPSDRTPIRIATSAPSGIQIRRITIPYDQEGYFNLGFKPASPNSFYRFLYGTTWVSHIGTDLPNREFFGRFAANRWTESLFFEDTNDELFEETSGFAGLRYIHFTNCKLGTNTTRFLESLPALNCLFFSNSDLVQLPEDFFLRLPRLERIYLVNSQVSDSTLGHLADIPMLRKVSMRFENPHNNPLLKSEAFWERFEGHHNLEEIQFSDSSLTTPHVSLKNIPNLSQLRFGLPAIHLKLNNLPKLRHSETRFQSVEIENCPNLILSGIILHESHSRYSMTNIKGIGTLGIESEAADADSLEKLFEGLSYDIQKLEIHAKNAIVDTTSLPSGVQELILDCKISDQDNLDLSRLKRLKDLTVETPITGSQLEACIRSSPSLEAFQVNSSIDRIAIRDHDHLQKAIFSSSSPIERLRLELRNCNNLKELTLPAPKEHLDSIFEDIHSLRSISWSNQTLLATSQSMILSGDIALDTLVINKDTQLGTKELKLTGNNLLDLTFRDPLPGMTERVLQGVHGSRWYKSCTLEKVAWNQEISKQLSRIKFREMTLIGMEFPSSDLNNVSLKGHDYKRLTLKNCRLLPPADDNNEQASASKLMFQLIELDGCEIEDQAAGWICKHFRIEKLSIKNNKFEIGKLLPALSANPNSRRSEVIAKLCISHNEITEALINDLKRCTTPIWIQLTDYEVSDFLKNSMPQHLFSVLR